MGLISDIIFFGGLISDICTPYIWYVRFLSKIYDLICFVTGDVFDIFWLKIDMCNYEIWSVYMYHYG